MVASGMYVDGEQSNVFQDITATILISLVSTGPQFLIKIFFVKSKPSKPHEGNDNKMSKTKEGSIDMERYQKISVEREKLYNQMYD